MSSILKVNAQLFGTDEEGTLSMVLNESAGFITEAARELYLDHEFVVRIQVFVLSRTVTVETDRDGVLVDTLMIGIPDDPDKVDRLIVFIAEQTIDLVSDLNEI